MPGAQDVKQFLGGRQRVLPVVLLRIRRSASEKILALHSIRAIPSAAGQTFRVIHNFSGSVDGSTPNSTMVMDQARWNRSCIGHETKLKEWMVLCLVAGS
jgi:hypothetical protein